MRINFRKSDLIHLNAPEEKVNAFAQVFGCKSRNKLLTRDNLTKRQKLNHESCLLYNEKETYHHLPHLP